MKSQQSKPKGLPENGSGEGEETNGNEEFVTKEEPQPLDESDEINEKRYPIVGIGASAGGLKAFSTFFDNVPDEPGMGFVIVQHLDPHHESELAGLLQSHTSMTVRQVFHDIKVEPNQVYVIPPGKSLSISKGILRLSDLDKLRGRRVPIDLFFRSLAEDQETRAVCMILSGTGSDGSLGIKAIKEHGGLVMAQSPEDAEYDGMPQSAIDTGLVDVTAPVDELAKELVEYWKSAERIQASEITDLLAMDDNKVLQPIFAQLQIYTTHNFSHYKRTTILRRLQRRMQVTQCESLASYLDLLRGNREEAEALFRDFLISVTNFFRDEESFMALDEEVIPAIFEDKDNKDQVRVWVPGCATGEEAYSIAILLLEEASRRHWHGSIQVFATDLDDQALIFARRGLYPDAIVTDVSPERLQRFFKRDYNGYKVNKELKEIVLFAAHNLIKDAPFAKLDLISCRNLLIYLNRNVQDQVFKIFHYALNPNGYLFLGGSESADLVPDRFKPVRHKHRIYKRHAGVASPSFPRLPVATLVGANEERIDIRAITNELNLSLGNWHRNLMLERYAPPSAIVDQDYQIRYLFGEVGRYLQRLEGEPTDNILENVIPDIRLDLRTSLFHLFHNGESHKPRDIKIRRGGHFEHVRLRLEMVQPKDSDEQMALVVFEPIPQPIGPTPSSDDKQVDEAVVRQLEEELKEMRHRLQTTIEEYETSNEELKASNEELQSMNEELRSTGEELETGREELQSTNEELTSVNQELKNKVEELKHLNSDMENLIEATNIPIVFLDRELRLKRYTPEATEIFNIISSDIGRPFAHISHNLDRDDLIGPAEEVLKTLEPFEEEVHTKDDFWYLLQIRPYRTIEDKIDGVVLTMVNITSQVRGERQQRVFAQQQAAVAELGQMALQNGDISRLMDTAVKRLAAILDVPLTKILELQPDGEGLLLKAGVGWQDSYVGDGVVPADKNSQAGFTLRNKGPVIVEDLPNELRFQGPQLLTDHDVVSGMSVIIHGVGGKPYGVMGAHATEKRTFSEREINVLQAVANAVAAAIRHHDAQQERESLIGHLDAEREKLNQIFWQAPAGIAIFEGPDHVYTYMNELLERSMTDGREVIGKPVREAFPELTGQGLFQLMDEVYATGTTRVIEEAPIDFNIAGEGKPDIHYFDVVYAPYRDENNQIKGVMGLSFDVTERVLARQQSESERRLLETVLEQMPEGVIIGEAPSGKLIMRNKQEADIFRLSLSDVDSIDEYAVYTGFHPEDGRPYLNEEWPLARTIMTGEIVLGEEILIERGDGTEGIILVSAAPIRNNEGEIVAGVVVFQDITERKEAEAERRSLLQNVQERERILQAVLEQMPSGLIIAESPSGNLSLYNKEAERLFNHPIIEAKTPEDYSQYHGFHPDGKPYVAQDYPIIRALLGEVIHQEEMIYDRKDGKQATFSVNAAPVRDQDGNIIMAVSTFHDISPIKSLQEKLETWNRRLEERVDKRTSQIRELASALAMAEQRERERVSQLLHDDLQQLLHAVQINLLLLETDKAFIEGSEGYSELVMEAQSHTEQAINLTRTLTVELSPPVLKNEGLAQSFRWLVKHMDDMYNLHVDLSMTGEPSLTSRDVEELAFQMVRELLFNVVKHTQTKSAELMIWEEGNFSMMQVSDDGRGFDTTKLKKERGFGYGLYNIGERIRLFGGEMKIESEQGKGTAVTLKFPSHARQTENE